MFKRIFSVLVVGGCFCCVGLFAMAQTPATGGAETSEPGMYMLFENTPINVASLAPKTVSTAPGIVSVITHQEIVNSGARNLNDLLSFVPGFVPAMEIGNLNGFGVRGLWSMEGKMLVMIDGIPMNELAYGNPIFANQFFTDDIDHIEIIRGPGSVIYGGYAELAVLNIITKGTDQKGGSISATYGYMHDTYGQEIASISYGNKFKDLAISFNGTIGDGHTSDKHYVDYWDQTYDMKTMSGQKLWSANFGLEYKDFSFRFIGSSLAQESVVHGDGVIAGPNRALVTDFNSYSADMKYAWHALDNLTVTPRFTYTKDWSWQDGHNWVLNWGYNYYRKFPTQEIKGSITADYDITQNVKLITGGEYSRDYIWSQPTQEAVDAASLYYWSFFVNDFNGTNFAFERDNYTTSLFGELDVKTFLADITAGIRYDRNSQFGTSVTPRLALTKELGDFYLKGVVSRAYRAPTMLEIYWQNPDLQPERATVYETEVGYNISPNSVISLNIFDIDMARAITYGTVGYANSEANAAWGTELQYRLKQDWGYLNIAYSYYRAYRNQTFGTIAADSAGNPVNGVNVAFPTYKATLNASIKIIDDLTVNPGLIYMSQRYYQYDTAVDSQLNARLKPAWIINLYLRKVFARSGWEIGFGVFNLLNQNDDVPQGYYDYNRPVPGYGREYVAKVIYNF